MAQATYDIEVFSRPLGQWQYAHTYSVPADKTADDVATSFVANNPHRRIEDVRVSLADMKRLAEGQAA